MLVERQRACPEERLGRRGTFEPFFKFPAFFPRRLLQNTTIYLGKAQRTNEQIVVHLFGHPFGERLLGREGFCGVADNVGVEQIPRVRLTFRPASKGRSIVSSAPTSGKRRRAARIPPLLS